MKRFTLMLSAALAMLAFNAHAAGLESFVGKNPASLLKKEKPFAKAYRATIKDQDLPVWTERLSVGHPAEAVTLGGQTLILMSACNPKSGCEDERFYILYEPADQSITGFFFLPPDMSAPGDHRMAASRWLGKTPAKERSDFLLNRALKDAMPETEQQPAVKATN
jgi:hypothetical protein